MNKAIVYGGLFALVTSTACGGTSDDDTDIFTPRDGGTADTGVDRDGGSVAERDGGPAGLPVLGSFKHTPDSVQVRTVGTSANGLNSPMDVAVNPMDPTQLWVVNQGDESVTVFLDVGTANENSRFFREASGHHFLARPAALAFGMNGNWASIHETDIETQGPNGTPADFMGPTLWTADLADFDGGHGSHLDMLHNTPNGMGIAWDRDNMYWVFDGAHRSITRYDFAGDHDLGGSDHTDGKIRRFAQGNVLREPGVPSTMALDHVSGLLYIADTGNNRIAVLDTNSGDTGARMGPNYDGVGEQIMMENAVIMTLIDGMTTGGMEKPSGLVLHDGILFVSDNMTSVIYAFDLEGQLVDYLETRKAPGSLRGLDAWGDRLWVIDGAANELIEIAPLD